MTVLPSFQTLFGRPPGFIADAPGRVNLIGEHTDYNGGFVLPAVIPQRTRVELAPRPDRRVVVWSANVGEAERLMEFDLGSEAPTRTWIDYVQGVVVGLERRGHRIGGADLRLESRVPIGSGLSSSAALEVAVARAFRSAYDLSIDDVEVAIVGKWAENEFVGTPTGVMDQMAASVGEAGTALFLDTRSMRYERVPIPRNLDLLVIDSGIRHAHASGEYRVRRDQCEEACRRLGVAQLRDLSTADLGRVEALDEPLGRRARHVVTEDHRVLQAVAAMRAADVGQMGDLFYASHASMRDDYEVSHPAVDCLVELASSDPDIYGARLTGGGFGGAAVLLARVGAGRAAAERIARRYRAESGERPTILVPE
jgi:galactokinase